MDAALGVVGDGRPSAAVTIPIIVRRVGCRPIGASIVPVPTASANETRCTNAAPPVDRVASRPGRSRASSSFAIEQQTGGVACRDGARSRDASRFPYRPAARPERAVRSPGSRLVPCRWMRDEPRQASRRRALVRPRSARDRDVLGLRGDEVTVGDLSLDPPAGLHPSARLQTSRPLLARWPFLMSHCAKALVTLASRAMRTSNRSPVSDFRDIVRPAPHVTAPACGS